MENLSQNTNLSEARSDLLYSIDPSNGERLAEFKVTTPQEVQILFQKSRVAQAKWAAYRPSKRAKYLFNLRETIINNKDTLIQLISKENGKPFFESLTSEIIPSIETISYYARKGPKILKNKNIVIHNPFLLHRSSYLNFWPLGVVAVVSAWNFPFFLPLAEIVMALIAGNSVIFKPSEISPGISKRMLSLFDEAGFPPDLVQIAYGDGKVGEAVIQAGPDKIFFTGSVPTGKKILQAAAQKMIPVNLELGGKDAMIVLPDADLDYATSAALWGAFTNSGQCCASTERLLVHESIAEKFSTLLAKKMDALKQGKNADLGFITHEKQKYVYERQIRQAKEKNAQFLRGGEFSENKRVLKPTLVAGDEIEKLEIYNEETFGPVVALTTFKSAAEAIQKTNESPYGLLAAVITSNISLGEEIARQLQVGTVTINEVMYTAGVPETPWGGVKQSGIGRTHSEMGLYEFVNTRHIHKPRSRNFIFKSLWWFPYGSFQFATFHWMVDLYRKSWIRKAKALPDFLWNLAQLIKKEKRL